MSLDGIVVRAIAHELRQLAEHRIHRIHQPDDHTLVLQLRGGGLRGQSRLLLSANPTYPRSTGSRGLSRTRLKRPCSAC